MRVEQDDDVHDLHDRLDSRSRADRAHAGAALADVDLALEDQVALADEYQRDHVAERHRIGAQLAVFLRETGVVDFHARIEITNVKRQQHFCNQV